MTKILTTQKLKYTILKNYWIEREIKRDITNSVQVSEKHTLYITYELEKAILIKMNMFKCLYYLKLKVRLFRIQEIKTYTHKKFFKSRNRKLIKTKLKLKNQEKISNKRKGK